MNISTGTNAEVRLTYDYWLLFVVAVILLLISHAHAVDGLTYFIEISRMAGGKGNVG